MTLATITKSGVLTGQALCQMINAIRQNYETPIITVGTHSPAYHFPNLPEPVAKFRQQGREPVCFWPQFDWHVLFSKAMAKANSKFGFICARPDEHVAETAGFLLSENLLMVHFPSRMIQRFKGAACIEESKMLYDFLQNICTSEPASMIIVMSPGSHFTRKILAVINNVIQPGLLMALAHGDTPPLFSNHTLAKLKHSSKPEDKLRYLKHLTIRAIYKEKEKQLYKRISHLWVQTQQGYDHWKEFITCSITLTSAGYNSEIWHPADKILARKNLHLPPNIPIIISSSVLVPKKRLDDLIKAAAIIKEKIGSLRLIINGYGENSEKTRLLNMVNHLNLQDYVTFTGYVSEEDLIRYYQAADVFVHLSQLEGGPVSAMQALATNTPIVMTPVGSVGEWVQKTGLGRLFPAGNISACAEEILNVLQSKEHPATAVLARKLWSWDARGTTMAKDIEQLWDNRKEFK